MQYRLFVETKLLEMKTNQRIVRENSAEKKK